MWVANNGARVGAAAFALGLSLAGPVVGVAAADATVRLGKLCHVASWFHLSILRGASRILDCSKSTSK